MPIEPDEQQFADVVGDHFYKVTIPADGDYTITVDWTTGIGSDIDMFFCESPVAGDFSNCAFDGATGSKPETAVFTLTAGTYFIVAEDFGGDADGTTLKVQIDH